MSKTISIRDKDYERVEQAVWSAISEAVWTSNWRMIEHAEIGQRLWVRRYDKWVKEIQCPPKELGDPYWIEDNKITVTYYLPFHQQFDRGGFNTADCVVTKHQLVAAYLSSPTIGLGNLELSTAMGADQILQRAIFGKMHYSGS